MMLRTLAGPPTEQHRVSLEAALQHICRVAHTGSLIYLISDFMDVSSSFANESGLSRLNKSCDVVFISINDAADQALVPAGVIGFCGQNREKVYVNTDSIRGRERYASQWEENRRVLSALTRRFKVPWIELSTESDISRDLLLGLNNIAKRKKCLL
jgi:hypothetical protein